MGSTPSSESARIRLAYRGDSMQGTFRAGDCLWVETVAFHSLKTGDVVAMDADGKAIAHRIAGQEDGGFITQGDGVLRADRDLLRPDRLIGKIVTRDRSGRESPVRGGLAGHFRARALHAACRLRMGVVYPLAPLYRWLRARGWMARIWRPRMCMARFSGADGELVKYIHRGRTVACWVPREGRWSCRKPYDLVLEPPSR